MVQHITRRVWEAGRILYKVLNSRYRAEPFLLSHLVTRRCDCRCETCLWSTGEYGADELSAEEIDHVYREARDLGFAMNAVWGGEPLIREDLPEIVRSSKRNRLVTTVITNGYYLGERLDELSQVDCFIVSIDEIGERHDRMRQREGIYERAIKGIERAKRYPDIKVMINSVFSKLNRDAVEDLVRLAAKLDVPIYLCPIETGFVDRYGFAESKQHLGLSPEELEDFCERVMELKRQGYRINNSLTYLKTFIGGKKEYKCHKQKVQVTLDANGDVTNCVGEPFGNVRKTPLRKILKSESVRKARRDSEKCNVCNNPDVIDCSYVWEFRPDSVWSFVKLFLD